MVISETRMIGRVMAVQTLNDAELDRVSGGMHQVGGYGSDSMCHIIYGDGGRPAGGEADDCAYEG